MRAAVVVPYLRIVVPLLRVAAAVEHHGVEQVRVACTVVQQVCRPSGMRQPTSVLGERVPLLCYT